MLMAFVGILLYGGSFILIRILVKDSSQNLHWALPHICLICSLLRETRLYILSVTASCSYVIVFGMLCYGYHVVTFNDWLPANNSHLFELLQDLSMDALNENESAAGNSSSSDMKMLLMKIDDDKKRRNVDSIQEKDDGSTATSQSTAELSKNVNTDQEKEFTAVIMNHEGQFNHLLPSSFKKSTHKISFRR